LNLESGILIMENESASICDLAGGLSDVNPWLVAATVILPTFMEVVDTSIASVTLPHIAGSLSASIDEATWVLTSYLAANAVVLPASGWFALRFGRKCFLLACIIVFTIASFACGSSTSLSMIVIARAIQGAAGGALQPLSQAILLESFPPEKRGEAMAIFGMGVVVAPIVGPTLGGWITDQYTWRWAFYINIPFGILALFMISRYITDPPYIRRARPGRLDSVGLGLLAIGLGLFQVVLDKGEEDDWFGALWIRWATLIIVVSLAAFITRELLHKKPIVNLKIFKDRNFAVGCLLIALFGGAIYGIVTLLPLFYQVIMDYTAGAAGVAVAPRGLGAVIMMPIVGILTSRIDNRWMVAAGFAVFGWTSLAFGGLTQDISQWSLLVPIIISGAAAGLVFVPLTTVTMGRLTNDQMGSGAGLFNLLRNLGGSFGISIVEALISNHQQIRRSELVQDISPSRLPFRNYFARVYGLMLPHSAPNVAKRRSFMLMEEVVKRESTIWAYVDVFRYLALATFLCIPVVFLLRKAKGKEGAVAVH
jgi:DHA2 family multidrug resistance protein